MGGGREGGTVCPCKLLSTYISNELVPESIIAAEGNCVLIGVILEQHDVSHSQNWLGKQGAEPSHPSQGGGQSEREREGVWRGEGGGGGAVVSLVIAGSNAQKMQASYNSPHNSKFITQSCKQSGW